MNHDPKDIMSGPTTQMSWWNKDNNEGLYLCPLCDTEVTTDLGILSYTCNFMNSDHMMELIRTRLQI